MALPGGQGVRSGKGEEKGSNVYLITSPDSGGSDSGDEAPWASSSSLPIPPEVGNFIKGVKALWVGAAL